MTERFPDKRDRQMQTGTWVYNMFGLLAKSTIIGFRLFLLGCLLLVSLSLPLLHAQELYYVNSPRDDLNVRRGPGTEHDVITQLPHGTPVFVQDRNRLWLNIVVPASGIEGWVSQRYLANEPPGDPPTPGELDRSEERKRFERLKRKGVIRVQADRTRRVLRISMSHLIWKRFNRRQQKNFLERASRLYRIDIVELRDRRGVARSRLTAAGPNTARFEPLN